MISTEFNFWFNRRYKQLKWLKPFSSYRRLRTTTMEVHCHPLHYTLDSIITTNRSIIITIVATIVVVDTTFTTVVVIIATTIAATTMVIIITTFTIITRLHNNHRRIAHNHIRLGALCQPVLIITTCPLRRLPLVPSHMDQLNTISSRRHLDSLWSPVWTKVWIWRSWSSLPKLLNSGASNWVSQVLCSTLSLITPAIQKNVGLHYLVSNQFFESFILHW